ncbi:hypothetical protein ADL26_04660, partial [Thermoactinomyces vulgaris]
MCIRDSTETEPKAPAARTPPKKPKRVAELERLSVVPHRGYAAAVTWGLVSGAAWGISVGVIYGLLNTFELFAWLPDVPGGTVFIGPHLPVPIALVAVMWLCVGFGAHRSRFSDLDSKAQAHRRQLEQILADFERRQEQHRNSVAADQRRFRREQQEYRTARNRFQAAQKRYRKEKRIWDHSWTCVDCGR